MEEEDQNRRRNKEAQKRARDFFHPVSKPACDDTTRRPEERGERTACAAAVGEEIRAEAITRAASEEEGFGMAGDDHVVVDVDGIAKSKEDEVSKKPSGDADGSAAAAASPSAVVDLVHEEDEEEGGGEEEPLIQAAECRICQEEDSVKNLEKPCACSGSLKYAHRACVQRWCNEKGDTTCEICHEEYKPGYTAPPRVQPDETTIDIDGDLIMDLRDPRILAVAAAQRRLLEAEYDGYATTDASGAAFCRSAALILMALLLLRHALSISDNEGNDDDASTMFSLFLLRAAGFLLPCYIMAWIFSILHRRRQRQEEAALAAAEVAFILQSARGRALQFNIAPDSPATPQHEPAPQQQQ